MTVGKAVMTLFRGFESNARRAEPSGNTTVRRDEQVDNADFAAVSAGLNDIPAPAGNFSS